ncbi:F-box protein PP2-B11-like [Lolium rigidum]|uniref:F-box protein PP2-B11-like n=1 Tax=Lolium rigidum TaxID=89674 RepID=UPI001F5DD285|nr:F-box protein PP2-B11-like [Lolium rigidum]
MAADCPALPAGLERIAAHFGIHPRWSMHLDRAMGAKCYTLSARALHISWGDTPNYWPWINLGSDETKRNNSTLLSRNLAYAAYMVFKLADDGFNQLDFPFQEASISISVRASNSTRRVRLEGYMEEDGDDGVPHKDDGWMEVELGEFYNEEGDGGKVSASLMETKGEIWKNGLVLWGIEIRAKS